MNVTDDSTETPSYNSQLAATIRLAPQFVNRLCSRLETAESMPDGVSGLLFGTSHDDVIVVQAFRSLMDSEIAAIQTGQGSLDDSVRELERAAENDPGLAPLDVMGWFAFRPVGGLHEADLAFHNRQFQSATDIALIVRRSDNGYLLFEFYTRSEEGLLTEKSNRWGAFRFSPAQAIVGPVEIALRTRKQKTTSEVTKPETRREEVSERRHRDRFSILKATEEPHTDLNPAPKTKRRLITTGELASVPAVIAPPKRSGVPWFPSAILFLIFAGGTFTFLLARAVPSSNSNSFWRALLPDTGLNLRVEGQGDRVLLSWNRRNSVVRSSAGAVLHIDDGSQHRDVHLDAAQVENGAVLYRPNSDDVSFRLDVRGQDGTSAIENLRVLDSAHTTNAQPLDITAGNSTSAAAQTASNPPTTTQTAHVWQPAPTTSQVAVPRPMQPAPALEAVRPSSERFDISRLTAPAIPNTSTPAPAIPPASSPTGTPSSGPQTNSTDSGDRTHEAPQQPSRNTDVQSSADSSAPQNPAVGQNSVRLQTPPPAMEQINKPTADNPPGELQVTKPAPAQPVLPSQSTLASQYVPPRPIRQVLPDISTLPPAAIASTSQIDVIVTVDKNGRVTKAQLQQTGRRKPPRSMATAAEAAARQWIFQPARLDGQTVPSEHSIIFQFGSR